MSLKLCSLASGSKGNCTLLRSEKSKILVDLGINRKCLEGRLAEFGVELGEIDAVVVTHSHSDHVAGLRTFASKFGVPIYAPYSVAAGIARGGVSPSSLCAFDGGDFFIKDLTVSPFQVPHDVPCYGYSFYSAGSKATVVTDLGEIGEVLIKDISDSDIVVLECNHDVDRLKSNPAYPARLKSRIMGSHGHLSNEACAVAAVRLASGGVRQIVLAHLSEQNNDPMLALRCVTDRLSMSGIAVGRDVLVDVAWQNRATKLYEIE